jgi:hypothetical protein
LETGRARSIGEGFNLAMVDVTASVENHIFNTCSFGALGNELTNFGGGSDGSTIANTFDMRARGSYGDTFHIVNHLCINMLIGEMNGESWTLISALDFAADALVNPLANFFTFDGHLPKRGWSS